jgi:Flp pilus assembly protein CpaB
VTTATTATTGVGTATPETVAAFRTLRRAPPRRPAVRLVVAAVVFAAGLLGSLAFWARTTDGAAVLVTTRAMAPGERLGAGDVGVVRLRVAEPDVLAAMVPASERERVVGQALAAPAQARQVLVRAQLGGTGLLGPERVALTIPVTADSAAGGRIRPGDEVVVYSTRGRGQAEARTEELLPRATVFEVGYGAQGVVARASGAEAGTVVPVQGSARAPVWLTLVLTRDQAQDVAQARRSGDLDVALLSPRTPAATAAVAPSEGVAAAPAPAPATSSP